MSITRAIQWCQVNEATIECKGGKFHVYTQARPTIITDSIEDAVTYHQLRDARIEQIGYMAYVLEQDENQQKVYQEKKEKIKNYVIHFKNTSGGH